MTDEWNSVLINGNLYDSGNNNIKFHDPGFLFGWNVFETLRIYDNKLFLYDKHINRILDACDFFNINFINYTKKTTTNLINSYVNYYLSNYYFDEGILRITISKGIDSPNIIISSRPLTYKAEDYISGYTITTTNVRRNSTTPICYYKTGNYLENMFVREKTLANGFNEAIFLNENNFVCEGTVSNIFYFIKDILYTPQIECGLLNGITRDFIINVISKENNISVNEGKFSLEHLLSCDEGFLCNCAMEIMPIVKIDKVILSSGKPGNKTIELMKKYKELICF